MLARLILTALSPFWAGLESGPYSIGFEAMPIRDYSRPFSTEGEDRTRLVTLAIWYPAETQPTRWRQYHGAGASVGSARESVALRQSR